MFSDTQVEKKSWLKNFEPDFISFFHGVSPLIHPVIDLITPAESVIQCGKLPGTEANQTRLGVLAALTSPKAPPPPPPNLTAQERKTLTTVQIITSCPQ